MACQQGKRIARIIGCGMTALRCGKAAREQPSNAVALMVEALQLAVQDAGVSISELDMLIALPSLMSEQHFMIGHAVAQQAHLTPLKGVLVRTLDVGGAGPVAALLAAKHAIEHEGRRAVAIVAGDTVASVPTAEFLARADGSCRPRKLDSRSSSNGTTDGSSSSSSSSSRGRKSSSSMDAWVPSPVIPNMYDRVARWHMQQYGTTREQLVSAGIGSSRSKSTKAPAAGTRALDFNCCMHQLPHTSSMLGSS
ncbi:hypothetical protein COO60DRAFT_176474 [Scenedesmus sp. NREL 46B-D3]|nr:hypothetical protein COO60DRAFT_176474 [Scenedesmus sp. NREL 46B-D3]